MLEGGHSLSATSVLVDSERTVIASKTEISSTLMESQDIFFWLIFCCFKLILLRSEMATFIVARHVMVSRPISGNPSSVPENGGGVHN